MSNFFKQANVKAGIGMIIGGPIGYAALVLVIHYALGGDFSALFISVTAITIGSSTVAGQQLPSIPALNVGLIVMIVGLGILIWPKVVEWRKSRA